MLRTFIMVCLVAFMPGIAYAGLDPEVEVPYHVRIVVMIGDHRLLTPVFRNRVCTEIRDSIQAALGEMGVVEVFDNNELQIQKANVRGPLLASLERTAALAARVQAKGLREALDDWKEVSGVKTHFVRIDYLNDRYRIRTRQFDGTTGLPSPVVRRAEREDRLFVARTAALMVERDFGIVGTLEQASGNDMRMVFKASALEGPLNRWVRRDDIFAIAGIGQGPTSLWSVPIEWAVLRVLEEPHEGSCRCRLLARYREPLKQNTLVRCFRCIKLGTASGPLRLRFVDETTLSPLAALQISVASDDLGSDSVEQGSTDSEGMFRSNKVFEHLAIAKVFGGPGVAAQLPVPILDDQVVVCRLRTNPTAQSLGNLEQSRKRLVERIDERLYAHQQSVNEISQLNDPKTREAVLDKAKAMLQALTAGIAEFSAEATALRNRARELGLGNKFQIGEIEDRLEDLAHRRTQLQAYIVDLENVIKKEHDPRLARLKEMIARAQLHESEYEFDKAIAIYEQVIKEGADLANVKDLQNHLDQLKRDWTPKNAAHLEARQFFVNEWPKPQTATQLKAQLGQAQKMLRLCRDNGDHLTPLLVIKANIAHLEQLKKRLNILLGSPRPEDRGEINLIAEARAGLDSLSKEAREIARATSMPVK
jgi:hypothetical protein